MIRKAALARGQSSFILDLDSAKRSNSLRGHAIPDQIDGAAGLLLYIGAGWTEFRVQQGAVMHAALDHLDCLARQPFRIRR